LRPTIEGDVVGKQGVEHLELHADGEGEQVLRAAGQLFERDLDLGLAVNSESVDVPETVSSRPKGPVHLPDR
jgi:hypothetical protein